MLQLCYNNMIQKADVEELRGLGYTLRELYILTAGLGAARWVVMHQNYLNGKQFQGAFNNQTAIDNRSLNTSLAYAHTLQYSTRRGKVQRPALLVLQRTNNGAHDTHHILIRLYAIVVRTILARHPTTKLHSSLQA
jgi:hypothetical protein